MDRTELRQWRKSHGLTQKELAEILGVRFLAVCRWEGGQRKIPSFLHLALNWISLMLKEKDK